ncbi:MAG: SpoIIE family protein phosphatase [Gemmataceae bacterium]|nr:SpoIIE family protein phosphatase [Gemmataceae bacterium]
MQPWTSRTRGIGFRTALAVDLVLLVGVAAFIAVDYLREEQQRVKEKMSALDDEAMTLHQALAPLGKTNPEHVQALVDKVCARMSEEASPGHHILVETEGRVVQSRSHQRDSDEIVQAIRAAAAAPDRRVVHRGSAIVTGVHQEGDVTVYVAEQLENIRAEVQEQVLLRSLGLAVFGIVLAAAVNVIIHRLVARPLHRLVRAIDAIRAGELGTQTGQFHSNELDRLALAINEMSRQLADDAERRRLVLDKARRVQENLLPRPGQVLPGVSVAAIHRPVEAVAGDFYDVLALPDGSVLCCVADVVGHGVPAAMVAAILKVLLLDAAELDPIPGHVIRHVNSRFTAVALPEDFASLLVFRWEPSRHVLCYASAGHEPGLLRCGPQPTALLTATGPLLGLGEGDLWESRSIPLAAGAVLVCLTDGVSETMNRDGQPFGRERLNALIDSAREVQPEQLLAAMDGAVQRHRDGGPPTDDYTLVVMCFDSESE